PPSPLFPSPTLFRPCSRTSAPTLTWTDRHGRAEPGRSPHLVAERPGSARPSAFSRQQIPHLHDGVRDGERGHGLISANDQVRLRSEEHTSELQSLAY